MKTSIRFFLALLLAFVQTLTVFADAFTVGGLCYSVTGEGEVAASGDPNNKPFGDIVIPETVEYAGMTYSVTSIFNSAFFECTGLTSVTIGNSVTSIDGWAFFGCSGLTSVTIGNSVTLIGEDAFKGCSGLSSIVVEAGNTTYDSRDNCNAIIRTASNTLIYGCKNTIIPNTVTSIGYEAFKYCSGLTSVTIPNSVTRIVDYAFDSCSGLTSITIPNTVTSIGEGAFYECGGLTSVSIGNSVTSIGSAAFFDCTGLTSVTIPNSVTSIGMQAFCGCSGLSNIYIELHNPANITLNSCVFDNVTTSTCVLHVPAGTAELYRAAAQWKDFANIVEMKPQTIAAASIALGREAAEMVEGETLTLTATVLPEDATDKSVTWASDNEGVATVADGVVTAVGAGTATITATTADGSNLSASCTVNVNAAAHNELAISDYSCMAGAAFTLDVAMNNSDEIGGFQFDLYLPEGFTIALNSKGKPDVTLNDDRVDDHTLMVNGNFDDGHYNILAFSLSNTPYIGNDGAVLHINLTAADAVAAGTHTLELRDIEISNPDGSHAWNYESLTSTITVIARGDANGDGRVSVTDVLLMAAAANGGEAAGLVLEAADMNGDGRVTVSDLLAVASIANNANGASGAPRRGMPAACGQPKARPYNGINLTATLSTDNRLAVDDVTVDLGETFTLPVRMINPDEIGGFQFDLYLPDGITVALNKKGKLDITLDEDRMDDHLLQFNNSFDDGHLHVQSFSMSNTPYYENDGPVVYVKLTVSDDATPGAYTARMRNVELSNPFGSASVWYEDGFTFGITITGEAGVTLQELLAGGEDGGEYTVSDALAVAYACSEFAVVTDGNGNWLKVTGADLSAYGGIEVGTLSGTLGGMAANPTLAVTTAPIDAIEVPYELTTYDMAASLAPKANELATVKGYYFVQNGQPVLRGYGRAPHGQSVTLDVTNVDLNNLIEGEQYAITAVVQLREAWSGAPRKVAAGVGDAYKNISLIVTQVPGETTAITDLNADDDAPAQRYNLLGQPVDDNYRGIVIERGRKILVR